MTRAQPEFRAEEGRLIVGGQEFKNYQILEKLGDGANGVVYRALNTILQREEAIKVWRTRNSRDVRNKVEQGLREAQKLARVSPQFAVTVYSAQEFGGTFLATMEYVEGKTLEWHQKNSDLSLRIRLAEVYLNSIVQTTTESTRHGDAHMKNVLVFEEKKSKYETVLRMKLCDFGTSIYSGKEASEQRHWRIVSRPWAWNGSAILT
jgi:serine/threonine protein kinase